MSRYRSAQPRHDERPDAVAATEHPSTLRDVRAAHASSSAAAQSTTRFSIRRNTLALGAVCLASLMFGLEISSVPVILPTLERLLHGDFKGMQWIMNAYTLGVTTVLMATGALADRFGRRRIFVIGIALFGITSLICGFAQSVPTLIVARLLQGASGGAMLICQVAVLSHQFSEGPERVRAFSAWGIILGIGLGFGPIIGGMIVAVSGWQWVFWIHALLAAVTLALVFGGVQESRDPHAHTLDVAGIVTLSLAVFGLTYYITQGSDLGFTSLRAILVLMATVVAFVAFLCAERLSARPMFDFSVFRIRKFSGALMGSAGMNFSFWPFMIYLPIYFQIGLGYDSVNAGLALLAYTLPTLLFPPLGERLALRYGSGIAIPAGSNTMDNIASFGPNGPGTSPATAGSLCDSQPVQQLACWMAFPQTTEYTGSRSRHPGGVNTLFGDGSVHFMKNSINPLTWVQLGSMASGEVISSDSY